VTRAKRSNPHTLLGSLTSGAAIVVILLHLKHRKAIMQRVKRLYEWFCWSLEYRSVEYQLCMVKAEILISE
jgi:hypothetical protein